MHSCHEPELWNVCTGCPLCLSSLKIYLGKFFQQRLEPASEFRIFAYGMVRTSVYSLTRLTPLQYKYTHDPTGVLGADFYTKFGHKREISDETPLFDPEENVDGVLRYPFWDETPFRPDVWVYDPIHIKKIAPQPSACDLDAFPLSVEPLRTRASTRLTLHTA